AGKSLEVIKVAYNYETQKKTVMVITSSIDDRHEVGKIWSRTGFEKEAFIFEEDTDLIELVLDHEDKPNCILIDEAQFLNRDQVIQLTKLVDGHHITVMCYGLKNDAF